ncbi:hypothetical protein JCM10908_004739 [Rhodotorula pacifica]|uniref:RNA polymerase-associated protein n=1 Tax=Rhodotorula pacifica TaxID=1495444 RepID=UPI0031739B49
MDIDDELLGLAEGTTTSKSRRSKSSSKRKRPVEESSDDNDSASDMDMSASDSDAPAPAASSSRSKGGRVKSAARVDESDDEDEDGPTEENPYPVEGIYKDEEERERISMLPELEREDFIATRQEEVTSRRMRQDVAQMAARSAGAAAGPKKKKKVAVAAASDDENDDDYGTGESMSRSTRSRKTTGSSKTKSEGIEKLKQSRAAKGKKKQAKTSDSDDDYDDGSKKSRRRAASVDYSGSDMDQSSSDDDRTKKSRPTKSGPPIATYDELRGCQATRSHLADMCRAPFFDEWVKDAWVRFPLQDIPGQQERRYRLYQIAGVKHRETYRVEGNSTDIILELRYGRVINPFRMDAVSNSPATRDEYTRMVATFQADKVPLPTPVQAKKRKEELDKHQTYRLTEEDISAQLAAKKVRPVGAQARARLVMELSDAKRIGDDEAIERIKEQLAELDGPAKEEVDRAKRINDRNRASNREEIKRAEARSQEERRKQAEALMRGDTNVKIDKSARVKTVPKHTYDSRPATPGGSGASTPLPPGAVAPSVPSQAPAGQNGTPRPKAGKIEAVVASRVQLSVDLDF